VEVVESTKFKENFKKPSLLVSSKPFRNFKHGFAIFEEKTFIGFLQNTLLFSQAPPKRLKKIFLGTFAKPFLKFSPA